VRKMVCFFVILVLSACAEEPKSNPVPAFTSVSELRAMMDAGETTSTAIVTELLRRSHEASALNAFITLDSEGALERANELDDMRREGNILGSLHGIPLVVKDNIHVAGLPNTAGTPGLSGFIPVLDSPVIAALKDAGAIILGKTNMHELAFGITSDNAAYGSVGNPYDPTMFPGGSSGGTASAVSAGFVPAGLGTDTGGSARIPAALTGVVGFRPSTDRYNSAAVTPISHTRDTVGLIARSVADIILMDQVIAPNGLALSAIKANLLRIGIPRAYYFRNLDEQSAVVIDAALVQLRDAGVTLVDVDPEGIDSLLARSAFPIALYEVMKDLPHYLEAFATGQDIESIAAAAASPDVQGLFASLLSDGQVPAEVYADALVAREELRVVFHEYFAKDNLDAMIFPTTLLPARPIENSLQTIELNGEQVPTFPTYIHNTDPASVAALPGISLPIGLTAAGLPVALEIDGPEGTDRQLLAIAEQLEKTFDFSARPMNQD
jgi:mandelamide amidase